MHFIGVDHHKQTSTLAVLDSQGRKVRTARLYNRRADIEAFIREVAPDGFMAVVEAGFASYEMADLLRELGGEVKMADPTQVKAIAHARIKCDRRDAATLGQLLRVDLIPEVYQRDLQNRESQRVLRLRAFWMRVRVQIRNKVRALLSTQREEVREPAQALGDKIFRPEGLELLEGLGLAERDRKILHSLLQGYHAIEQLLKRSDRLVTELHREMRSAQLIDTVPGFAKTLSVLVAVEIADIRRFPRADCLQSYAGLIPSTYSSGERTYHGHLKRGNLWLRWALIEAVYPAIRKDPGLSIYYSRLARKKGPNIAKVATARKLMGIIYRILKENRSYRSFPTHTSAA